MSIDVKGVQISCKNKRCISLDFVQFINFKEEVIISLCSKCGTKMFIIPLSKDETLRFEQDYIEQELKAI